MKLNNKIWITFIILLIIFSAVYKFDYKDITDWFLASFCSFLMFYCVYRSGLEEIRKKANKESLAREILLKKEKRWKIFYILLNLYVLGLLLMMIFSM